MNFLVEYGNETISGTHIHILSSLISLMSTHFVVRSFTILSDLELTSMLNFQKRGSNYYYETKFNDYTENAGDFGKGYVIIHKSGLDLSKVLKVQPKLILAVVITEETNPTPMDIPPETAIPPITHFFSVFVSKYPAGFLSLDSVPVLGKCFRLYKPASNYNTKIFPLMFYGGVNESKWYWQNRNTNWNSYTRDVLNMSEVNVTIGLVTPREKNKAKNDFLSSKNAFFWNAMADFLKFRAIVHVERISPRAVKNMTRVYLKLLMTVADGLAVLPVMSSERTHKSLKFIVTGLDSKYHLLVRSPQYVHSWQSTLKPFSHESWFSLGMTILLISFILRIVTYSERSEDINLSQCFLTIFGFICSQGCPNISKAIPARLVCYTALLFSIIIYQFYTSNFCSLLSTKEVSLPFNSLEQLITKKTHFLYVHPDTAIYTHIVKAESGLFKKLYDEILKKDPFHQLKSDIRGKALDNVCKGTGAILGLPFQTIYLSELWCTLVPVNSGYFPTSVATAIRSNFPFQFQFRFVHLRLLEAGVAHKFRDEFLNFKQQRATKADVTNEPVSLKHVAFLLAFYAAFIVLSILMLCFEIVFFKSSRKTNISESVFNKKTTSFA